MLRYRQKWSSVPPACSETVDDKQTSSVSKLAKKLSTTALSQQFPGRLMEHCKPYRILAAAIRVMEQRPHDLPLVHGHRESRVRQRGRDACPLAQPSSRREYKSNSTATYSHPSRVATNVMSLAHFWFGWVAVNCRCNTFSARTSDDGVGSPGRTPVADASNSTVPQMVLR